MKKEYIAPVVRTVTVKVERCCIGIGSDTSNGTGSLGKGADFDEEDSYGLIDF